MDFYKEALKKHLGKLKGLHDEVHADVMNSPNEDPENKMQDEAPELKGHEVEGKVQAPSTVEQELENKSGQHNDADKDADMIHKILGQTDLGKRALDASVRKQDVLAKHKAVHAGMKSGKLMKK